MEIQYLKRDGSYQILMIGGWITDEVCKYVNRALQATCWNFNSMYTVGPQPGLGNVVAINIEQARDSDVQEFCDYLNTILRDVIPRGLMDIGVSPYNLPEYDDCGGLDVLHMIIQETGCDYYGGAWPGPVVLKPISNVQYNSVIDLLKEFKMTFHNYIPKEA